MPKTSKAAYYAVRIGRQPGIYHSWAECEAQVKGFVGALYKKLNTRAEANEFMAAKASAARSSASRDIPLIASSSRAAIAPQPILSTRTQAIHPIPEEEKDCDIVYCDGACKGNGQPGSMAGIGVWWGYGDPRNIAERCPGDQTNNRAELVAIVRILETTPHLNRPLLIKTDSHYSIRCVTSWIFKWMRNGFLSADGKPVKNRALIKYLAALLRVRRKTSQTVEFKHVRGHVGIQGNEAADELANLGATMPMLPERDWEKLEKQALQTLKPVAPLQTVDDDLEAYADGLLSDDELAELADMSFDSVILPARQLAINGKHVNQVPHDLPRVNGLATANTILHHEYRLPPRVSFGSDPFSTLAPSGRMSREELEAFASCLLDDGELFAIGRDGMFDSDV